MNAMPNTAPAMQPSTVRGLLNSVIPRMKMAGRENIMPADAPLTAEAMVWLMLFSMIEWRPISPRRMPKPRIAASSEPSMEKPSLRLRYPIERAISAPIT